VADLRAATPSAAAEILTEGVFAAGRWIGQAQAKMGEALRRRLQGERRHFQQLWQRVQACHPRRGLNQRLQLLDDLKMSLNRCLRQQLQQQRLAGQNLAVRLDRLRPARQLAQRRATLLREERQLRERARQSLRALRQGSEALQARLRALGPEQVLARGYSITLDAATGKIIRQKEQTRSGQTLKTKLHSGEVQSVVKED
jgi:exodeoxyribonuclease VII large subunit